MSDRSEEVEVESEELAKEDTSVVLDDVVSAVVEIDVNVLLDDMASTEVSFEWDDLEEGVKDNAEVVELIDNVVLVEYD